MIECLKLVGVGIVLHTVRQKSDNDAAMIQIHWLVIEISTSPTIDCRTIRFIDVEWRRPSEDMVNDRALHTFLVISRTTPEKRDWL